LHKSTTIFEAKDLSIGYSQKNTLLKNLNFEIKSNQIIGLVATNGTGKSTLIKSLSGSIPVLSGSILVDGKNINSFHKKELAKKIALVLTDKPNLTGIKVRDLVEIGRYPHTGIFGKLTTKDTEITNEAILLCGISHLTDKFCNELSDGEFQKAMLARAIAQETSILFLDEPTSFLDYPSKLNLMKLLSELTAKKNTSIIIASHDLELLKEFTNQLLIIKRNHGYKLIDSNLISVNELVAELTSSN
jgi:iron complex transport system ATP-binding protein